MMNPTLQRVIDMNGNSVKKTAPKKYGQVIPSADAATITDYMTGMVIDHNWASFNGLNAAGKTGTADHLKTDGTLDKPHSWFIGFAPADNPKIAVAVIVENGGFGADAAAPIVAKIMSSAINR
jgi:cell division protein FtsI/penicillin-binding protein 2